MPCDTLPRFWRDAALPFIEVRAIADGRKVRYGRHAHSTFSIGAVTGGHSTYLNGNTLQHIGAGAVVIVNPEVVHACNPAETAPWVFNTADSAVISIGDNGANNSPSLCEIAGWVFKSNIDATERGQMKAEMDGAA